MWNIELAEGEQFIRVEWVSGEKEMMPYAVVGFVTPDGRMMVNIRPFDRVVH